MDINDLRIAVTLLSFAVFAGIVGWAMSSRNRRRFDEAAMLPFADDSRMGGRHE
jgi:cytochrome c oxidase cbb3-type subunit 4